MCVVSAPDSLCRSRKNLLKVHWKQLVYLLIGLIVEDLRLGKQGLEFMVEGFFPSVGIFVVANSGDNNSDGYFKYIGASVSWLHFEPLDNIIDHLPVIYEVDKEENAIVPLLQI